MSTRTAAEVRKTALDERARLAKCLEALPLREVREAQLRIQLIDQMLGWFDRPDPAETRVGTTVETAGY